VLILDEPTAVLTPREAESLFDTLAQLVAEGLSLIFISHKLDEVLRVSDRIAVLRGGKLVATLPAAGADKASLAELMVGREVRMPEARAHAAGAVVCALQRVSVGAVLHDVSLTLHARQITAIAGVSGNGQQALADVLCGMRAADSGSVQVLGTAMAAAPRAWIAAGVARVPEDRHAVGTIGDLPLWENAMAEHASVRFAHAGVVRRRAARGFAQRVVDRFDVRSARGLDTTVRALSGGNMQKLVLGRALLGASGDMASDTRSAPVLIVANQPTWGLDIGAVAFVHQQLLDACASGSAVLLISDDLDEIFALADRIAVMHAGHLTPAREPAAWNLAAIGLAMVGSTIAPANATEADHAT
ncbi:MAG: ATP-binding cassette domain-containing protein, partial [Betaproteobacteria bacterium]